MGQPSSPVPWEGHEGVPCWTFRPLPDYVVAGHKGEPEALAKGAARAALQAGRRAGTGYAGKGQATDPWPDPAWGRGRAAPCWPTCIRPRSSRSSPPLSPRAPSSTQTSIASTHACQPGATGTRRFATPEASMPATTTGTGFARSTSTPWKKPRKRARRPDQTSSSV